MEKKDGIFILRGQEGDRRRPPENILEIGIYP